MSELELRQWAVERAIERLPTMKQVDGRDALIDEASRILDFLKESDDVEKR